MLERLITWAEGRDDLRALLLIGSRARASVPADEWSDYDLILVTPEPGRFLEETDWLADLGHVRLTFLEPTLLEGVVERRVLFDGGVDVDFVPVPVEIVAGGWPNEVLAVFARGLRVLVDKDGLMTALPAVSLPSVGRPSEDAFLQVVNDFLYHVVWTAKKLGRGELWTAKSCSDGYLKALLRQVLEWQAQIIRGVETWHQGRFLDQWVEPCYGRQLPATFGLYELADQWRALLATLELFGQVALEVGGLLGYEYPVAGEAYVRKLLVEYQGAR